MSRPPVDEQAASLAGRSARAGCVNGHWIGHTAEQSLQEEIARVQGATQHVLINGHVAGSGAAQPS